ncbi:YigZ family protein [Fructilactobacillus frigidiflavus]|uniref:YigZ family protein n=1 Tax=Fructilactobacillus frigidiflavus TaxID=3242688 RepID=UPI003756C161
MKNKFLTIAQQGTHEIDIKKSKFIANVKRVNSEAEAKLFIETIVAQHKKANHNCFAYLIGETDNIQRESDNGEPSGTAGVPILEVLKNNQLHDTIIVVTRYFGGIKLGAGGLIRAYSNSASQVIEKVGIVEKLLQTQIDLSISYPLNDKLQYYLKAHHFNILNVEYGSAVKVSTAVLTADIDQFKTDINNLLAGNVEIQTGAESYFEVPYQAKE